MKQTTKILLTLATSTGMSQAAVVLDVDYSSFTAGDTFGDGERIEDISGNGYHGFWGDAAGSYSIVTTATGVGIDTSLATRGHTFHRDGLTGIPTAWDGGTTSTTPYFTLGAATSYTFESVVQFASTTAATAGIDGLMGQTGGNEAWIRANNGSLQYTFNSGSVISQFGTTIDISSAYDGNAHNIALVLDRTAGEIRSYLDGTLIHTDSNAGIATLGGMLNGSSDFRTAAYNTIDSNAFTGISDRYRISDTALTSGDFLAVPEPSSTALLGLGGLALILRRRK
mgnify:CR=1 FL=1